MIETITKPLERPFLIPVFLYVVGNTTSAVVSGAVSGAIRRISHGKLSKTTVISGAFAGGITGFFSSTAGEYLYVNNKYHIKDVVDGLGESTNHWNDAWNKVKKNPIKEYKKSEVEKMKNIGDAIHSTHFR